MVEKQILRFGEVQKMVRLSRSTVSRLEKKGLFPKRVMLGANSVGWLSVDIDAWIESKVKASHSLGNSEDTERTVRGEL